MQFIGNPETEHNGRKKFKKISNFIPSFQYFPSVLIDTGQYLYKTCDT